MNCLCKLSIITDTRAHFVQRLLNFLNISSEDYGFIVYFPWSISLSFVNYSRSTIKQCQRVGFM